jgi:hypothetical protein
MEMLWAATLWEEGIPLEHFPFFFDDKHACPKKFPKVPRLRRRRADTVRRPVLDVPGQCLKIRHGHVARGILIEVVVVRGLAGGYCFGGGNGGGGRELCDVALSYLHSHSGGGSCLARAGKFYLANLKTWCAS